MQISGMEIPDNQKKSKISKILLVAIILIFILIVGIMLLILYIQKGTFKVYIDGVSVTLEEETIVKDDSGKIYISIKDIAKALGYDAHNGEFKLYTEDTNKCYVDNENETASFFLNSNKISKTIPKQTEDYEDYTIQEPVISKNEKLYCSAEGIQVGFNVTFNYDEKANSVQIYTLPYLVEFYTPTMVKYGYEGISKNFNNQKAILYNMFIVNKEKGLFGVVTKENKEIISPKYKEMEFNENAQEFYVTDSTSKVGIVTNAGKTKINLLYDSIYRVDKKTGLYVVKSNNKYGVLSNTGDIVIHLEYEQIGVDTTSYPSNNISNKYLLYDNMIPVYRNKKWGVFDKTGKLIIPIELDALGFVSGTSGNSSGKIVNNLLLIPSYKAIVVGQDYDKVKRYGVYDNEGNQLIPLALQSAYSVTNGGVDTYYMEYNNTTLNIEDYIARQYEKNGKKKPTETTNQNTISTKTNS